MSKPANASNDGAKTAKPVMDNDPPSPRRKIVRAAEEILRRKVEGPATSAELLEAVLDKSGLKPALGWRASQGIGALVKLARKKHAYHAEGRIKAGDVVLFHNTTDANRNGQDDDWYTMASVAIEGRGPLTVTVGGTGRAPRAVILAPDDPHRRRSESGRIVNSFVRSPSRSDSPHQEYLAGELYAGFIDLEDFLGH